MYSRKLFETLKIELLLVLFYDASGVMDNVARPEMHVCKIMPKGTWIAKVESKLGDIIYLISFALLLISHTIISCETHSGAHYMINLNRPFKLDPFHYISRTSGGFSQFKRAIQLDLLV